jgi:hypothetical protein
MASLFYHFKFYFMTKLSKKHFWDWFKRHHTEFLMLRNKSKKETGYWLSELNAHLRAYYKFFGFSLTWHENKTATLTITTGGKPIHFKKADDMIAKAPVIPGWDFVALDQPRPINFYVEDLIMETGIDPEELKFAIPANHPMGSLVIIYHPLVTPGNYLQVYELAHGALYNLLGERSFGTDIAEFEVANLSYAKEDEVEELEALPARLGSQSSGLVIDDNGNLVDMYE